jgi:hypothetical protein
MQAFDSLRLTLRRLILRQWVPLDLILVSFIVGMASCHMLQ